MIYWKFKFYFCIDLIFIFLLTLNISAQQKDSTLTDPVNITAQAVIYRYVDAIGGSENLLNVTDRILLFEGTSFGQPVKILIKQKYPDKLYREIISGDVTQKLYFDGNNAEMFIGENKIEIDEDEIERIRLDAALNLLLDPVKYDVQMELAGIEIVDSTKCFKIKFTSVTGNYWYQYFDEESGLRIIDVKEVQTSSGLFEQKTYYSDYRKVDGLKFPFSIRQKIGSLDVELSLKDILINSGIEDSEFKSRGK